jgi:hypothetical protein
MATSNQLSHALRQRQHVHLRRKRIRVDPGYTTNNRWSSRSASAERIDGVSVGASARVISMPIRRPFRNNNKSSSAPACVRQ